MLSKLFKCFRKSLLKSLNWPDLGPLPACGISGGICCLSSPCSTYARNLCKSEITFLEGPTKQNLSLRPVKKRENSPNSPTAKSQSVVFPLLLKLSCSPAKCWPRNPVDEEWISRWESSCLTLHVQGRFLLQLTSGRQPRILIAWVGSIVMSQPGKRGAPAKSKHLFFFWVGGKSLGAVTAAPSDSLLAGFIAVGVQEEAEEGNCSRQ